MVLPLFLDCFYSIIFILAGKLVSNWDATNLRLVGDNGLRY